MGIAGLRGTPPRWSIFPISSHSKPLLVSNVVRMSSSKSLRPPESVSFQGSEYSVIREGLAGILGPEPKKPSEAKSDRQDVFYNPVQQYNRDLSVLAVRAFAEDYLFQKNEQRQHRSQVPRGIKRKRREITENTEKTETDDLPMKDSSGGINDGAQKDPNGTNEEATRDLEGSTRHDPKAKEDREAEAQEFKPPFRILDALSATGFRAMRYAKEVKTASKIVANDMSKTAVEAIKRNADFNEVSDKVQVSTGDAIDHMHHACHSHCADPTKIANQLYHVIDLDPYGTSSPFIDSAVRALVDGGLLCVTSTDSGVFASVGYLEKTYSLYGGLPIEGAHSHEGGLRLIIHDVARTAARYGLAIEPLLSLSIDFYARIFIRIHRSPAQVKHLASKTMTVYNCHQGCGAWSTQLFARTNEKQDKKGGVIYQFKAAQAPSASPECTYCGFRTHMAGPMWAGPLHNPHFIRRILSNLPSLDPSVYATKDRIAGMLSIALQECTLYEPPMPPVKSLATSSKLQTNGSDPAPSTTEPDANSSIRPVPPLPLTTRAPHPFFLHTPTLARTLKTNCPSDAQIRGALLRLGYRCVRSHTKAGSIATDAPWSIVWHVMREWIRQEANRKEGNLKEGTAGWGIINRHQQRHLQPVKDGEGAGDGVTVEDRKTEERSSAIAEPSRLPSLRHRLTEMMHLSDVKALRAEVAALIASIERQDQEHGQGSGEKGEGARDGKVDDDLKVVFDERLGKKGLQKDEGTVLYALHPPHWGPQRKAGGK